MKINGCRGNPTLDPWITSQVLYIQADIHAPST